MATDESVDAGGRPTPHTYEVVRGAVVGMLTGSAAGAVTALVIGAGLEPVALGSMVGVAMAGTAVGASVGVVVGVVTGVLLRILRGASDRLAAVAAGSVVGLGVLVLGAATTALHDPQGVALWAVVLGGSAGAASPWIRRGS